jgi:hypothetical protein
MAKILRVGLYRIRRQGDPPASLLDLIARLQALPPDEARAKDLTDDPIRPRNAITVTPEYALVDFSRIRQTDRIELSDRRGDEGQITFGPGDKRPCVHTAVLVDYHCNIIYVHEQLGGVSHAVVARYFAALANADRLPVEVVMNLDGIMRLQGKVPNSIKIRLSGIDNAEQLRGQGYGDDAILNLLREFRAPKAVLTLGLEEGAGSLDRILQTATAILSWNGLFGRRRPVKEISIRAEDEDHEELVNLLKDRMVHLEEIELEVGREPTDAQRYRAVINAWQRYRVELRQRYPVAAQPPG